MITVYKSGKKVSREKPDNPSAIPINILHTKNISKMMRFLKHAISDFSEIGDIKNDVGFLMNEMFKRDRLRRLESGTKSVTTICIFVCIPSSCGSNIMNDIIFRFDLFHMSRILTEEEINSIHTKILKDTDTYLFFRTSDS